MPPSSLPQPRHPLFVLNLLGGGVYGYQQALKIALFEKLLSVPIVHCVDITSGGSVGSMNLLSVAADLINRADSPDTPFLKQAKRIKADAASVFPAQIARGFFEKRYALGPLADVHALISHRMNRIFSDASQNVDTLSHVVQSLDRWRYLIHPAQTSSALAQKFSALAARYPAFLNHWEGIARAKQSEWWTRALNRFHFNLDDLRRNLEASFADPETGHQPTLGQCPIDVVVPVIDVATSKYALYYRLTHPQTGVVQVSHPDARLCDMAVASAAASLIFNVRDQKQIDAARFFMPDDTLSFIKKTTGYVAQPYHVLAFGTYHSTQPAVKMSALHDAHLASAVATESDMHIAARIQWSIDQFEGNPYGDQLSFILHQPKDLKLSRTQHEWLAEQSLDLFGVDHTQNYADLAQNPLQGKIYDASSDHLAAMERAALFTFAQNLPHLAQELGPALLKNAARRGFLSASDLQQKLTALTWLSNGQVIYPERWQHTAPDSKPGPSSDTFAPAK